MLVQWNETKDRPSPQVSPYSSDAENNKHGDKEIASSIEEEVPDEEESNGLVLYLDKSNGKHDVDHHEDFKEA